MGSCTSTLCSTPTTTTAADAPLGPRESESPHTTMSRHKSHVHSNISDERSDPVTHNRTRINIATSRETSAGENMRMSVSFASTPVIIAPPSSYRDNPLNFDGVDEVIISVDDPSSSAANAPPRREVNLSRASMSAHDDGIVVAQLHSNVSQVTETSPSVATTTATPYPDPSLCIGGTVCTYMSARPSLDIESTLSLVRQSL